MSRALSFGNAAAAYERFRLGYPDAVVDRIIAYAKRPVRTALEVGAGTGKATRVVALHGVHVTATEPDTDMIAELRKRVPSSVTVVPAGFEDLELNQRYDLVYAAAAFHWTRAEGRWDRVVALLEPGGVFASFGGPLELADETLVEAARAAQREFIVADDIVASDGTDVGDHRRWPGTELATCALFVDVEQSVIERRLTLSAPDYVSHLSTTSAYLQLSATARDQLAGRLLAVLPNKVEIVADITVHLARRR